jgi:hypothetical protein
VPDYEVKALSFARETVVNPAAKADSISGRRTILVHDVKRQSVCLHSIDEQTYPHRPVRSLHVDELVWQLELDLAVVPGDVN